MDQSGSSSHLAQCFSVPSFEYSMDHKRRGKCVIFNNIHFDEIEDRFKKINDLPGNEDDVQSLESCFGGLGFEVIVHNDLKTDEIKSTLKAISEEDHSDADCLVFCFITFKIKNFLLAKDGKFKIDILFEHFDEKKCPSLARKPKLCFVQGCPVKKELHRDSEFLSENGHGLFCGADKYLSFNDPFGPDFFFSYSRSSFMQTLAEIMSELGPELSIFDVFTKISHDVALELASSDPHQRDSLVTNHFTLTRRLVFKPKA